MTISNRQDDEFFSVNSASRDFFSGNVSPWTIRTWIRTGQLKAYKAGLRVLLKREDLEALLKPREVK